jgi:hypothetical protein
LSDVADIDQLAARFARPQLGSMFDGESLPSTFRLTRSAVSSKGVVIATYERAGEVKAGSFALAQPTTAELERCRKLT